MDCSQVGLRHRWPFLRDSREDLMSKTMTIPVTISSEARSFLDRLDQAENLEKMIDRAESTGSGGINGNQRGLGNQRGQGINGVRSRFRFDSGFRLLTPFLRSDPLPLVRSPGSALSGHDPPPTALITSLG